MTCRKAALFLVCLAFSLDAQAASPLDVPKGQPLVYINSLLNVSLALNMGDYAHDHAIESGGDWSIRIHR